MWHFGFAGTFLGFTALLCVLILSCLQGAAEGEGETCSRTTSATTTGLGWSVWAETGNSKIV